MKRFLHSFFMLVAAGFSLDTQAQTGACGLSNVVIQNIQPVTNTCVATFDVAFTLSANAGSKYVFFQTFIDVPTTTHPNGYPNYFKCTNNNGSTINKPPVLGEIGSPILNVAINNNNVTPGAEPTFTTYLPDTRVGTIGNVATSRIDTFKLANGDIRFFISGLRVTIPEPYCGQPISLVTDVFATQSASANTTQCVSCGIRFASNFFSSVTGFVRCNGTYSITFNRNPSATNLTASYQLYADANGNEILTTQAEGGSDVAITPTPISLGNPVPLTQTITGTVPAANIGQDLFVVLLINNGLTRVVRIPADQCAPLPVNFKAFNATRQNQNVVLTWETATEETNKGFYIQRNTGNGWIDLSFVNSKATNGNSNSILNYEFTDVNNFNGITQYRLQQLDINGVSKFSQIRTVKGDGQANRTVVFPNPSSNGTFNIAFDNAAALKNVYISDISGRMLQQWKSVTQNLQVDNLKPGVYTLRIVDVQTGRQTTEKVIVNKQ